jgi:hypothetical protein
MEPSKSVWELIKIYFPDVWQYLVVIIVMIIAGLLIL